MTHGNSEGGEGGVSPLLWLYVSKRLDLDWVPIAYLWDVESFTAGSVASPVAYYRLSPRVLAWLEFAGGQLEQRVLAGEVARDQLDAYLEAMNVVWWFAAAHLDVATVREARKMAEAADAAAGAVELPECGAPK